MLINVNSSKYLPWQPELFELVVEKLKLDLELKIASCAALWMF